MKVTKPDARVATYNVQAEEVASPDAALAGGRSLAATTLKALLGKLLPVAVAVVSLPVLKRGWGPSGPELSAWNGS
jgi:hypothetical protein